MWMNMENVSSFLLAKIKRIKYSKTKKNLSNMYDI